MPIGLNFRPQAPLVDKEGQISEPWFKAFLTGGALTALIDLLTEVINTLRVVNGGTGRASLTAHDVLVGNGSSPVTLVSPSTAGFVLTSTGVTTDPSFQAPASAGTVTHTGTLTSGQLIQGNGGADITVNATTATVTKLTAGVPSAASAGTDYTNLAFKTIQVSGQSDVVADSAADTLTLAAGSNITITTNAVTDTVTIAASGSGTVTTTGSPANGNLAQFSGATSITNWQGVATSVIGRSANSTGNEADIQSTVDNQILVRRSSVLGFTALQDVGYWSVLTDGAASPALIFDSFGDVIAVWSGT